MRADRLRRVLALAVAIVTAAAACEKPASGSSAAAAPAAEGPAEAAPAVGAPVPRYAVTTLAGEAVEVGVPNAPLTLINVWATWCTSCREEMADLDTLHQRYAGRGLRVVAVSIDAGPTARVQRYVDRQKLSMRIAHDADARIQSLFQVAGVPSTYLVGPDGTLRWMQVGGIHGSAGAARAAIDQALAGDSARVAMQ